MKWLNRFWYLRGAVAAIALLSIAEFLFGWPKWEVARFILAAIYDWNNLSREVGRLIGSLPLLPHLSPQVLNGILLASLLGFPASFAIGQDSGRFLIRTENPRRWRVRMLVLGTGALSISMTVAALWIASNIEDIRLEIAAGPFPDGEFSFGFLMTCSLLVNGIVYPAFVVFSEFKRYRRGAVAALTALIVLQIVYFAPYLHAHFEQYADRVLGARAEGDD